MKKAIKYVLRQQGTTNFVKRIPHDFLEENFVHGWNDLQNRALCFDSEEAAQKAIHSDPDGYSLTVETLYPSESKEYDGPPNGTAAHTAWMMTQSIMKPE